MLSRFLSKVALGAFVALVIFALYHILPTLPFWLLVALPTIIFILIVVDMFLLDFAILQALGLVVVVPEKEAHVIERFRHYNRTLNSDIHLKIPGIEADAYQIKIADRTTKLINQQVITQEGATCLVDSTVIWRVVSDRDPIDAAWRQWSRKNPEYAPTDDPVRLAAYGIADLVGESDNEPAVMEIVTATLRSYGGQRPFRQLQNDQPWIDNNLPNDVNKKTLRDWGIWIDAHKIEKLTPPESLREAMEAELKAKQEAAAEVARSEGELKARTNRAEADLIEQKRKAEGNAYNQEQEGQAVAAKIAAMAPAVAKPGGEQAAEVYLKERAIEELAPAIGKGTTTYFMGGGVNPLMETAAAVAQVTRSVRREPEPDRPPKRRERPRPGTPTEPDEDDDFLDQEEEGDGKKGK